MRIAAAVLFAAAVLTSVAGAHAQNRRGSEEPDCVDARQRQGRPSSCAKRARRQPSQVAIEHNVLACSMGFVSTHVAVIVDGERFEFAPFCNAPFTKSFRTRRTRVACKIHSFMCFGFVPIKSISVECSDGGASAVFLQCPKKD